MANKVSSTKKTRKSTSKNQGRKHNVDRNTSKKVTGRLFKPILDPSEEKGSLKAIFKNKTSTRLIKEARSEEFKNEKLL